MTSLRYTKLECSSKDVFRPPSITFLSFVVWWNGTSDHTLFLGHCMRQDVALIACLFFFFLVGRVAGKEGRMRYLLLQMEMRQI